MLDGAIHMLERWKSAASVRTYDHVQPATYANFVRIGTTTDGSGTLRTPLPTTDPSGCIEDVEAALAELDVRTRKRAQPASSGRASTSAATSTPPTCTVDVGGGDIEVHTSDTWGLVGTTIDVPNALWGWTDGLTSACEVTGLIGQHSFSGANAVAYAICDDEGNHYPVRASYLATLVTPPAKRAALRKKPPPKPGGA